MMMQPSSATLKRQLPSAGLESSRKLAVAGRAKEEASTKEEQRKKAEA